MNPPVLLIIGPPHHGKTEARKILSELTHMKGESTSSIIYHFLAQRRGISFDALKLLPKEELRPILVEAGDFLCACRDTISEPAVNDALDNEMYRIPSALVRTLYLNGVNIIDGVRRRQELLDARSHLEWNGVRHLTLWIERPDVPAVADNSELSRINADEVVLNDGTLEQLKAKLLAILEKHFGPQDELKKPLEILSQEQVVKLAEAAA